MRHINRITYKIITHIIIAFLLTIIQIHNCIAQDKSKIAESLTFHASFDNGLNADYSRGDDTLYSYSTEQERIAGGNVGFPDNSIKIAKGAGRFGDALLFTNDASFTPFYKDGGNLGYNDDGWSVTVSVWLRLTPEFDLGPGYCDPVQIIGEDRSKGFIFLEFDRDPLPALKNPPPKPFRYSLQPIRKNWNPDNINWADIPFKDRPMVQVDHAPFSRSKWTHVVFTVENANAETTDQSGALYIDGRLQGSIDKWDITLDWDPAEVLLVLGYAYVGHLDELAIFDRALSKEEVRYIFDSEIGINEFY